MPVAHYRHVRDAVQNALDSVPSFSKTTAGNSSPGMTDNESMSKDMKALRMDISRGEAVPLSSRVGGKRARATLRGMMAASSMTK
jgi:hypothetical protein